MSSRTETISRYCDLRSHPHLVMRAKTRQPRCSYAAGERKTSSRRTHVCNVCGDELTTDSSRYPITKSSALEVADHLQGHLEEPWYLGLPDEAILARCREERIRALSIRQPYAEWILAGRKQEEYRNVNCNVRGPVLLYASLSSKVLRDEDLDIQHFVRGKLLGMVSITGCGDDLPGFAWQLAHPHRFSEPVTRPKGRQPQPAFWRPWP